MLHYEHITNTHLLSSERRQKGWKSPVYGFFAPKVRVVHDGHPFGHRFTCAAPECGRGITRWLDKKDATSTSNLRTHVESCRYWGEGVLEVAMGRYTTADEARPCLQQYLRNGKLTSAFERAGKGKVTYSTTQHTSLETR